MNKPLVELMDLCSEMLIQARLMTAYSGQTVEFNFPQDPNWYVGQTDYNEPIHYTANVFAAGERMLSIPDRESKFSKLFNRISASRVLRYQFNYLLNLEVKFNLLRENYTYLQQAHQAVAESLRHVIHFLNTGKEGFILNKLDTLQGLHFCTHQFEKNPLLHKSHCEQVLLRIIDLIICMTIPPDLDRDAELYCSALIVLLEKVDSLVRNYHPMGTEVFADHAIRKIIRSYPLLGYPRPKVKQHMDLLNEMLKKQFELKQMEFTTLMTSLMLCYSDALVFPQNLQKYIAGDRTAINFNDLMKKSELDLNKTNIVRGNLVEGELYRQLDLPTSFQPVFQHYKAN